MAERLEPWGDDILAASEALKDELATAMRERDLPENIRNFAMRLNYQLKRATLIELEPTKAKRKSTGQAAKPLAPRLATQEFRDSAIKEFEKETRALKKYAESLPGYKNNVFSCHNDFLLCKKRHGKSFHCSLAYALCIFKNSRGLAKAAAKAGGTLGGMG